MHYKCHGKSIEIIPLPQHLNFVFTFEHMLKIHLVGVKTFDLYEFRNYVIKIVIQYKPNIIVNSEIVLSRTFNAELNEDISK